MILFYTGNDPKDESVDRFRDNYQIKHRNTDSSSEERLSSWSTWLTRHGASSTPKEP
jgi:hypothetical protein